MPDDHGFSVPYAYFGSLFRIIDGDEVYAAGGQGISHWSASKRTWQLQLTALTFEIHAVFAYAGNDVWAVGQSGDKTAPSRMIAGLCDIVIVDYNTGFSVGPNGAIVNGTKDDGGNWSWAGIHSPTNANRGSQKLSTFLPSLFNDLQGSRYTQP